MDFIKRVAAGAVGGFIGGAIVGADEAIIVAVVGDLSEYWAFFFGAVSYGVLGALMGLGWGAATLVTGAVVSSLRSVTTTLGSAAGLVVALLGMVVGRFRIIRDVFAESLPIASAAGSIIIIESTPIGRYF